MKNLQTIDDAFGKPVEVGDRVIFIADEHKIGSGVVSGIFVYDEPRQDQYGLLSGEIIINEGNTAKKLSVYNSGGFYCNGIAV
jgi:hypothetical protein